MNVIAVLPFLLSMVPGSALLGYANVAGKQLLDRGIPEYFLIAVSRSLMAAVFCTLLFLTGVPALKDGFWFAFCVTVTLNMFGQWVWYRAFKLDEASFIGPLRLMVPILTLGTGFLFLGEVPTWWGAVGVFVSIAGIWFLIQSHASGTAQSLRAVFNSPSLRFALAGAVAFSISFVFDKQVVVSSSALVFSAGINAALGILSFAATALFEHDRFPGFRVLLSPIFALHLVALGGANYLAAHALNFAPAAYASSVKRLESFWTVLFAGAFLKEGNIVRKAVACSVMLLGVALTIFLG
jgi:drug/metabolite transporter (DMT)-like permease